MKNKKIIAACPAGLGNRIKCMMSSLKQFQIEKSSLQERCVRQERCVSQERCDLSPYVYWPVNKQCGCKFDELFSKNTLLDQLWKGEFESAIVDAYNGDAYINKSWKLQTNKISAIDFKYHKLSQSQINEFLPCLREIEPKEDIQDAAWAFVNKYKESFDKGEVVGVHIRKGDFKRLYDGRAQVSQEDDFIERMACLLEVNPNYKFLLCTEDEETEEKFKEIFGKVSDNANADTIIYFPKRYRNRNDKNGVKEAFVDILLLSSCQIIIGTFLSTFTEIAWWFGGCKAQVCIPGTENKEAVDKVLAKLPQEGEGIHKKIWRKIKILGEGIGLYGR